MKPRTEQFLYLLLWSAEPLMRPTFRNMNESFQGWAYRHGLSRHLATLERQLLVERRAKESRLYRLTEKGKLRALGGRDPKAQWSRPWDGRWRLVCFDLPTAQNAHRDRLRLYLRNHSFGVLQRSVWIIPDPLDEQVQLLKSATVDVGSLIFLEARTCGGEADADIVEKAWDFRRINELYDAYLQVATRMQRILAGAKLHRNTLLAWAETERSAWKIAIEHDPLLPQRLLPRGYAGKRAWGRRVDLLRAAARVANAIGWKS